MTDAEKIAMLRAALQALLGSVDFRNHCCHMMSPVAQCIDKGTFIRCDEALEATKNG